MDNMSDGTEKLSSTVSLLRKADNSISPDELENSSTMLKVVDELGLLSFLPKISTIIVHKGQHAKEKLILEDKIINRLARELVSAHIVISRFNPQLLMEDSLKSSECMVPLIWRR